MKQFKMKISTLQPQLEKNCCNQKKLDSEKYGLKTSKA